jgi:hypothetical protein
MRSIPFHHTIQQGKQRMVTAQADIGPRMDPCAALPHENSTGPHPLTAKFFYAQPLTLAIPAIARCSLTLFVCHGS